MKSASRDPLAPPSTVPLRHYSSLCFYKLVVLSAWVWQQLDVPCFCPMPFLLHSHSMTSVKRASSFHENSHSTRTRSRVSRKPVILNVSRFSKRMSPATQERKKILHRQHAWCRLSHATRPGKQTRQAGRSGLTAVTSVWLQSGSFPSSGSSLQDALERGLRMLGLGFHRAFICDQDWVWFAFSLMQLSRAWDEFYSGQKYYIPLPLAFFETLANWKWLNSLYW